MVLFLFGVSMGEVIIIFLVILMLFGSKRIPELARGLGRGLSEFRKAADDIKREISEQTKDLRKDLSEMESDLKKGGRNLKQEVDEVISSATASAPTIASPVDDSSVRDIYGLDKETDEEDKADDTINNESGK